MSETYCEHCDLPLSTCVHGRPPVEPPAPVKKVPAPRKKAAPRVSSKTSVASSRGSVRRTVARLRTPQAAFRPHLIVLLREHGGACEVDLLMDELVERMADVLLDGDHEQTPQGELRWRYAARFERKAMTEDGLMAPPRTAGVWELTDEGRGA